MKKTIKLIFLFIIFMGIIGCNTSNEKKYSESGLSITMEKGLFTKNLDGADAYFVNDNIAFTAVKKTYEELKDLDINKDSTINEYASAFLKNSNVSFEIKNNNDLVYFDHNEENNNTSYYYLTSFHKSSEGFWICTFACNTSKQKDYQNLLLKWSQTISFNQ